MSINSKCKANPKNAHIVKSAEGESPDYISLKTIKEADTTTVEGIRIRNKAIVELRDRYEAVIEGSKRKLQEMCSGHTTVLASDVLENYSFDCYEHFMMAVDGMDLKRIQHMKGSYSFYIQLARYLAAYNRKVINQYCGGMPKEKPLVIYRPIKYAVEELKKGKVFNVICNGTTVVSFKIKSTMDVSYEDIISNGSKTIKYSPDYTYMRDVKGRLTKVLNTDGEVILENVDKTAGTKLNAYNVRSEWTHNSDGEEVSVFDTDRAGMISVEDQWEHEEESKILREAIANAYSKFSGIQKNIWDSRLTQSAEQYEKKVNDNKSAADLASPSRPKYEDLGVRCSISASEVKENMKAMRLIVATEVEAANRKYHTDIKF